ncbi:MAG: hypothetical protein ACLRSW_15860 [Christensenellaceae bacterium]
MFDGSFTVKNGAQKYTILIHVEDARAMTTTIGMGRHSPEHYEEDVVIYFNEKFGEKQVTTTAITPGNLFLWQTAARRTAAKPVRTKSSLTAAKPKTTRRICSQSSCDRKHNEV